MKEYWEENLHTLNRQGLINRLDRLSRVFNSLPLPEEYDEDQLYFIAKEDYEAIKIGLSKKPLERFFSLQSDSPKKLILLYYYDPMEEQRRFKESLPNVRINPEFRTPTDARKHQTEWLYGGTDNRSSGGEWSYPDDRALRVLIKKGMIYLKGLMAELGVDYNKS